MCFAIALASIIIESHFPYLEITFNYNCSQSFKDHQNIPNAIKKKNCESFMLTFREAAIKILTVIDKPIHYRKITDIAIKKNLIDTYSDEPQNVMYCKIANDIKLLKEKS